MLVSSAVPVSWGLSVHLKALPFETRADVLAILPGYMRDDSAPAPLRDAMADAWLYVYAKYCSDSAAYAASGDAQYAEGSQLDFCGKARGIFRAFGESDPFYRARVLDDSDLLTPAAIMAQVTQIVQQFKPGAQPYYFERPDDEIFVFDQSTTNLEGFYLDVDFPIVASKRYWQPLREDLLNGLATLISTPGRANARPRYGFVWDCAKLSTTPRLGLLAGADYTDVDSGWGHTIVAVPAFPLPGGQLDGDALVQADPSAGGTVPLVDINGLLTPAAVAAAASMGDAFNIGIADNAKGSHVYTSTQDVATAAAQIQGLLATRTSFPCQFTLMLDPVL